MFKKILIANRAEIACRIANTARRLGIDAVAVYSTPDAAALHVATADEAIHIGPAALQESYLNIKKIIAAAQTTRAEAIHPGYGFLSENPAFARACEENGIAFIGPPAAAIESMGSKSAAKTIMREAAVPLLPGYHGDEQDAELLQEEADRLGYPLLIKPVAGGGGKGMRLVERADDFPAALAAARREARNAFADDRVLLEKYLPRPRHIEIQIFRDNHGNSVFLFERDCSVQRRHQKILEEAPAPAMPPSRREAMGAAALGAAAAIDYRGAGTVEFIVDGDGAFYFLEMNTRLQVEHPVTEMITGQDLVEWQLRVAAGEPLPLRQQDLTLSGHALEARLYAEDPDNGFLPCGGVLSRLRFPSLSQDMPREARVDTGVRQGDAVSVHYDPLLAKLIVHGPDRVACLRRMEKALAQTQIVGVKTNLEFLARIVAHPRFQDGAVGTDFIAAHEAELFPDSPPTPPRVVALAALYLLLRRAAPEPAAAKDPYSPWNLRNNWRLAVPAVETLRFRAVAPASLRGQAPASSRGQAAAEHAITIRQTGDAFLLEQNGIRHTARARLHNGNTIEVEWDAERLRADIAPDGPNLVIFHDYRRYELRPVVEADAADADDPAAPLAAPMPGKITAVLAASGQSVQRGQPLLIMEAMKMEHTIAADRDGVVKTVIFAAGDMVEAGAELIALE